MSDPKTITLKHSTDVVESKIFIETNADGVVTIATNNEAYETFNFVFLNSSPLVSYNNDEIIVSGMQRTKSGVHYLK